MPKPSTSRRLRRRNKNAKQWRDVSHEHASKVFVEVPCGELKKMNRELDDVFAAKDRELAAVLKKWKNDEARQKHSRPKGTSLNHRRLKGAPKTRSQRR